MHNLFCSEEVKKSEVPPFLLEKIFSTLDLPDVISLLCKNLHEYKNYRALAPDDSQFEIVSKVERKSGGTKSRV